MSVYNTDPQWVKAVYHKALKALGRPEVAAQFKPRETKSGAFILSNTENAMNAPLCEVTAEDGDLLRLKFTVVEVIPAADIKAQAEIRAKILAINPTATPEQIAQAARALTGKR